MARNFDGLTDRIDWTTNVPDLSAGPWTVAVTPDPSVSITATEYILNFSTVASGVFGMTVFASATDALRCIINTSGNSITRTGNNGSLPSATLSRIMITWNGNLDGTNIKMYADGAEVSYASAGTGTGTPIAWEQLSVSGRVLDDLRCFNGDAANCALWDVVLDAGEIAAYGAKHYSPQLIRPSALRWAPPLIRDTVDPITGVSGTLDGTTVSAHPRVIMPESQIIMQPPVGVVAPTFPPQLYKPENTLLRM